MDAVDGFAELVDRPAAEVELDRAALAFARLADPTLVVDDWLQVLDHLAWHVDDFDGLRRKLFSAEGFTGASRDYYAPENSLLHRVLERRVGIPITLSVVMMEVGRRAGVAVEGVGAPGHFIVRDPATGRLCDPFAGGAIVGEAPDADEPSPLDLDDVPVVDAHQILARMLNNLAHVYRARGRLGDVEWVLRCQAAIPGARVPATLQLGQALADQGRFAAAAAELRSLALEVEGPPKEQLLRAARGVLARLN